MMRATRWILTLLLAALAPMAMAAAPTIAGERHGVTTLNSAAIRDSAQRDVLRFTAWSPALPGSEETPLTIGPPDAPLFAVGRAATHEKSEPSACQRRLAPLRNWKTSTTMMGWHSRLRSLP